MLQKNKGSVLVLSVVLLSFIMTLCIGVINIVNSNESIEATTYIHESMKQRVLGGIEISKSKIIEEVDVIKSKSKNKDEFIKYFLGNNRLEFIRTVTDLSESDLDGVIISIYNNQIKLEGDKLKFNLSSKLTEGRLKKSILVDVEIQVPNIETEDEKNNEETTNNEKVNTESSSNEVSTNIRGEQNKKVTENIVSGQINYEEQLDNEMKLVRFYNIKEI